MNRWSEFHYFFIIQGNFKKFIQRPLSHLIDLSRPANPNYSSTNALPFLMYRLDIFSPHFGAFPHFHTHPDLLKKKTSYSKNKFEINK